MGCQRIVDYLNATEATDPLFLHGDALSVLSTFPDAVVDTCLTSPPYWRQRQYAQQGLGSEASPTAYIERLAAILEQVKRVLKPTGSLWLNLGDTYANKALMGIPWRAAITLIDTQHWVMRNSIIWHKQKGGIDSATDKLSNVHENIFHFVKHPVGYYYNLDEVRRPSHGPRMTKGRMASSTGVSGIRYRQQIERSTVLTCHQKDAAILALDTMIERLRTGELSDFRMIIRGEQRITHSDAVAVSGRAREIAERGFYFIKAHPKGSKPSDVWTIPPEDTHARRGHYAAYPAALCRIPILTTCPPGGIVLDPFCGTGTTMIAANALGRKSVGIDLAEEYIAQARKRNGEAA